MSKAQPKRPTSVRVGHRDITIVWAPQSELDDAMGDYLDEKQRIRIGDWLLPQTAAETVMHELLHACWPRRWSLVGDIEETFVTAVAPVLAQVWRDNPSLVLWLTMALEGDL